MKHGVTRRWKVQTPLGFAGGHVVARAELDQVRWASHCPGSRAAPSGGLTTNSRPTRPTST